MVQLLIPLTLLQLDVLGIGVLMVMMICCVHGIPLRCPFLSLSDKVNDAMLQRMVIDKGVQAFLSKPFNIKPRALHLLSFMAEANRPIPYSLARIFAISWGQMLHLPC